LDTVIVIGALVPLTPAAFGSASKVVLVVDLRNDRSRR
jgi:hypothetical protein